jgi:hypothetical protein
MLTFLKVDSTLFQSTMVDKQPLHTYTKMHIVTDISFEETQQNENQNSNLTYIHTLRNTH